MHVDDSDPNVVILTVWTENVSGTVTIAYANRNTLIPDNTCAGLEAMTATSSATISFEEYTAKEFRFFKPIGYTGSTDFDVRLTLADSSTKTATEATP